MQRGNVFLRFEGGAGDGAKVTLRGFTANQYRQVLGLARAGRIHDPLFMRFIRAFSEAIGHDLDAASWTDAETVELLRWLEVVPGDEWTALDDIEFATLAGGAS